MLSKQIEAENKLKSILFIFKKAKFQIDRDKINYWQKKIKNDPGLVCREFQEFGEFVGPITVGFIMDIYGNNGFIYSAIIFTLFCLSIGLIRSAIKNKWILK